MTKPFRFDVALSFAGEDREYVAEVAGDLRASGISVFYDRFEEVRLWGKNLYVHLTDIYENRARFSVMFVSDAYAQKAWCDVERRAMQARAYREYEEYILPARFDDTAIPELDDGTGFIDLRSRTPAEFASLVRAKLVQAGFSIPSRQARRADFSVEPLPRRDQVHDGLVQTTVSVVDQHGIPVAGAQVAAVSGNGTAKVGVTDATGVAAFGFRLRREMDILIAHPATGGAVVPGWDPFDNARVVLPLDDAVGSIICNRTCYIPGLAGRLNVILDDLGRTYLYANNMAFDGERRSPAAFETGIAFLLEDADGVLMEVTIMHVRSDYSLLRYVHGGNTLDGDEATPD